MRVFISADLEGITGVVHTDQTHNDGRGYPRAQELMTAEVNAAVAGAVEGGATEVIVNDSHGSMRNILIERLDPRAHLISGTGKPLSMMQGIDASFAAALFVGYHARAGTPGVISHTYSGVVQRLVINGREVGETGMNAGIAGYFGVPVTLVAGDSEVVREARELLGPYGELQVVAVKEPQGRYAALNLSLEEAHARIRAAARQAVQRAGNMRPYRVPPPVTFEVTFTNAGMADLAGMIPGAQRPSPVTVSFTHDDYLVAFGAFRAMVTLAGQSG